MVIVREHKLVEEVSLARLGKSVAQVVHIRDGHLPVLAALEHDHRYCESGQLRLQEHKVAAKREQFPIALPQSAWHKP